MPYSEKTFYKLRRILDSFELMALNYCLNAQDDNDALQKVEFIENSLSKINLKPLLDEISLNQPESNNACPSYMPYLCDGVCSPYPCCQD